MDERPPSDVDQGDQGVSLREAARRLEIGSVQTVQRWLESGRLRGKRTALPNGREKWEVFLPSDPPAIERLRAQLRRPANPSDVLFPGPPDVVDHEKEALRSMNAFLMAELEARRGEVAERDRLLGELLAASRRPAALSGAPWWSRAWRALRERAAELGQG
jgi:hypothetical protein